MARSIAVPGPRRIAHRSGLGGLGVLTRPLRGAARAMGAGLRFIWERRRLRIALLAVLIALALLGGGWTLLRHSSLTAIEHVRVQGLVAVHGADTGAIEAALTGAAHGMSTLDVKPAALRAAVASYPIVRSVRAQAKFPHGLRIEVVEQPPVAALVTAGGARTAVAVDGVVLGPGYLSSSLPVLNVGRAAWAGVLPAVGESVRGAQLLTALTVLGAAPPPLARVVTHVYWGPKGLTVVLGNRLLACFGDATRPHAKWLSLIRVLADPSSAGAAYIDVRLPERPAAGFAPGTARPEAGATATEPASASDPATASELAAGLDAAVGGGSSASASGQSASAPASAPAASSTESSSTPAQAGSSGAATEAGSAGAGSSDSPGTAESEATG
jgi:cell division protein FtsQ